MIGNARGFIAAAMLLASAQLAAAELNFNPYVAGRYQYESNVYKFSNQVANVTGTRDTADRSARYEAGIDTGYTWQQQKLQFMVEGRQFDYQQFAQLDHREYAFAAVYTGTVLDYVRGVLDLRDERRMASFEDRRTTRLTMEREQAGRADFSVSLTPAWRVVTGVRGRNLRSPLPDAPALPQPPPGAPARVASPDFGVHEAAFNAGVQYGIESKEHPEDEAPLLIGGLLEYSTVNFSGVSPQPPPPPGVTAERFDGYSLLALSATAAYAFNGLSSLDGKVGVTFSNPTPSSIMSRPRLTGEITYLRRMSLLTELRASLFGRIVPYFASGDSTADTGVSLGAKWEPIRDLTFLGDYSIADSAFSNLSGVAPENAGRRDMVQNATFSVAYPQLNVLFLRLFANYSDRRSNRDYDNFNDIVFGAELSYRWRRLPPAAN